MKSFCRNVLFDLDGTLIDSKPGIVAGLRHTLRRMGHELSADQALDWAIGPPLMEVLARLLAAFGDHRSEEAAGHYRTWYAAIGLFDARPYPGVSELLDRLNAAGQHLFVGTSKRTAFARTVLEHFGLAARFRGVYGSEPHGRFDRKADLIRHVLETEKLEAADTVVVGDREHDVAAARANGLRVVAVAWGYGDRKELAGADHFCDGPGELDALL